MLGWQAGGDTVRAQLGRHAALDAHAPTDLHDLVRPQLGETEAPQRFHMHEDVRSAFATRQKPKTTHPIEPFDPGPLPVAFRRDLHVCALSTRKACRPLGRLSTWQWTRAPS